MELNPRLQVEHPCTEMVSGVNLPAAQLLVAMGIPLHLIPDIRRLYGHDLNCHSRIDFYQTPQIPPQGHVIACRITAEDASSNFKPEAGLLCELSLQSSPDVWGYFGIGNGGSVHQFSDSQFGHVFARGRDREHARLSMISALREINVLSKFSNTVEYLVKLLKSPNFIENTHTTAWLDKTLQSAKTIQNHDFQDVCRFVIGAAAWLGHQIFDTHQSQAIALCSKGQRVSIDLLKCTMEISFIHRDFMYSLKVTQTSQFEMCLEINGSKVMVGVTSSRSIGAAFSTIILRLTDNAIQVQGCKLGGDDSSEKFTDTSQFKITVNGMTDTITYGNQRDPSEIIAPSPGRLVRFLIEDGVHVECGQNIAEIEVMKMYMTVQSCESGTIKLVIAPGSTISAGDLIAKLKLQNQTALKKCPESKMIFPEYTCPEKNFESQLKVISSALLDGRPQPCISNLEEYMSSFITTILDKNHSLKLTCQIISNIVTRLPSNIVEQVNKHLTSHDETSIAKIQNILEKFLLICDSRDAPMMGNSIAAIRSLSKTPIQYADSVISSLIDAFNDSIAPFDGAKTYSTVYDRLRASHGPACDKLIHQHLASHSRLEFRTEVFSMLLQKTISLLCDGQNTGFLNEEPMFIRSTKRVTRLHDFIFKKTVQAAREALMIFHLPSLNDLIVEMEEKLLDAIKTGNDYSTTLLVNQADYHFDVLPTFFHHSLEAVCTLAMETYIRRVYEAFTFLYCESHTINLKVQADYRHIPSCNIGDRLTPEHEGSKFIKAINWVVAAPNSSEISLEKHSFSFLNKSDLLEKPITCVPTESQMETIIDQGATTPILDTFMNQDRKLSFQSENETFNCEYERRAGVFASFDNENDAKCHLDQLLEFFRPLKACENLVYLSIFARPTEDISDSSLISRWSATLTQMKDLLADHTVRRVTIIMVREKSAASSFYTFRRSLNWAEDAQVRHLEPAMSYLLELPRISANYAPISLCYADPTGQVHIYKGSFIEDNSVADRLSNNEKSSEFKSLHSEITNNPIPIENECALSTCINTNNSKVENSALENTRGCNALGSEEKIRNASKVKKSSTKKKRDRLFVRVLIRPTDAVRGRGTLLGLAKSASKIFEEILDSLATVQAQHATPLECTHLYIHLLPTFHTDLTTATNLFSRLMATGEERLLRLGVMEGEIRMNLYNGTTSSVDRYRIFLWNETGFVNRIAVFKENRVYNSRDTVLVRVDELSSFSNTPDHLKNRASFLAKEPHPSLGRLQIKRNRAHALETSYVYDFPTIFERAIELEWESVGVPHNPSANPRDRSESFFKATELIMQPSFSSIASHRQFMSDIKVSLCDDPERTIGTNEIGMVGWVFEAKLPFGDIRFVTIANDIDHQIGSFGVAEDCFFAACSRFARENGLPRIFLSANSGARIGLAEELKGCIQAQWIDSKDPRRGFEYLYLSRNDYLKYSEKVKAELIAERNHYKLTDVLGGLGVEVLSGSALIASETNLACEEGSAPTISFVTGRSVGIGAYLVRLGQRVIQRTSQPIILTGVAALNKILGKEVYTSNLQIGGPQIMAANGVSHLVVRNDLEGAQAIIRWLSYQLPAVSVLKPVSAVSPFINFTSSSSHKTVTGNCNENQSQNRTFELRSGPKFDPEEEKTNVQNNCGPLLGKIPAKTFHYDDPERKVGYMPPFEDPYDPRLLVTGTTQESGLLDKGSWIETLSDWARSVVVGRGRIGGIPLGIVLVETRTMHKQLPADPAAPDTSTATSIPQAGQVWHPDSAFKTAQFIRDTTRGENLPLLILANWRGFSGGQQDLYDQVLKFGALIVETLRESRQPVFVYLPPHAQLRGGSWVVVDGAINERRIEMYASPSARGGIMEAEGLVAIKFKKEELSKLADRLLHSSLECSIANQVGDDLIDHDGSDMKLKNTKKTIAGSSEAKLDGSEEIALARNIACAFADLHDRPGRMKALGVIRGIIEWSEARRFFFHRLSILLWQTRLANRAAHLTQTPKGASADQDIIYDNIVLELHSKWLPSLEIDSSSTAEFYNEDARAVNLLEQNVEKVDFMLRKWCSQRIIDKIDDLFHTLSQSDRSAILARISQQSRG